MSDQASHQSRSSRPMARLALAAAIALAPALKTLRFGAPLPLTGALAPEALKQQQGYDLWAETVNAAGGINVGSEKMKVEIVYTDYQSNTPRAVQAAEKLITQEKVDFLFSPFGSGAAKAASTVSERYGVPTIASTASSSQVYDQGYKYLFGTFTPNDATDRHRHRTIQRREAGCHSGPQRFVPAGHCPGDGEVGQSAQS